MTEAGLRICCVAAGSAGEEAGILPGDILLRVNGHDIRDIVDYLYYSGDPVVLLELQDAADEIYEAELYLCEGEDTGLHFDPVKVKLCKNHCPFCFVDQMPRGFRPTLYLKDDDWRTSFLHGSYVTLTNLSKGELERIKEQRISPLYISVHATDDSVRRKLLGNDTAPPLMPLLSDLARSGIRIYAQAVVVAGQNDGEILDATIRDLFSLYPAVDSLAVVPVGLTCARRGLSDIKPITESEANAIIDLVESWQRRCKNDAGTRFVFAADELYLKSRRRIPASSDYEDFSQIENGVGLVSAFLEEAHTQMDHLTGAKAPPQHFVWVIGKSFLPYACSLGRELHSRFGLDIACLGIENQTFGSTVTVTGLLTGKDIRAELEDQPHDATVVLPSVIFRDKGDRTLDNMTPQEVGGGRKVLCTNGGDDFVRAVLGRRDHV